MKIAELRVQVLLAMQVALLGMVTPAMRAVLVLWSETEVRFRVIFDGQVSKPEEEVTSEIESELISHLPDHEVHGQAEGFGAMGNISPMEREAFVFLRAM